MAFLSGMIKSVIIIAIIIFLIGLSIVIYWSRLPKEEQGEDGKGVIMWYMIVLVPAFLLAIMLLVPLLIVRGFKS